MANDKKKKKTGTIKTGRKKHLRNLPRNKSGRSATVKMATYTGGKDGNRYFAAPTITFRGNEKARPQSFKEALSAGEVYEFKKKKRAEKFAAGSWKKGEAKKEAMKAYRQRGNSSKIKKYKTKSGKSIYRRSGSRFNGTL